jgi:uncharacterized protein (UPF0335 family)
MGHNSDARDDTFDVSDSSMALIQYLARVERLNEEIKGLQDDRKDVFSEAKANGFDPAIMRRILALRKMEPNARQELDALMETYRTAVGI